MITDCIVMMVAIAVCAICFIIKNIIGEKYDKYIPLIAGILGVLLNWWVAKEMTPLVLTQGLVSGLGATGMWELVKIPFKIKEENTLESKEE